MVSGSSPRLEREDLALPRGLTQLGSPRRATGCVVLRSWALGSVLRVRGWERGNRWPPCGLEEVEGHQLPLGPRGDCSLGEWSVNHRNAETSSCIEGEIQSRAC